MTAHFRSLRLGVVAAAFACAGPALALDGVVASIKPVHSLVAAVMEGVGEPTLIVRGTGSEHAHSLRPSDAQALEDAKIVFWIGPEMETFLRAPLDTLAAGATVVALGDAPGLTKLDYREGGPFEAHSHAHEDDGHDHGHDHAHGDGHDDAHDHDDDDDDEDGHAHAGERHDLHVWLDPVNAQALLGQIERTLSEADPANAARYRDNARAYSARLDGLVAEVEREVAPVRDRPAIVFHDAYQYFEHRFGINVAGSISVNPEVPPSAQRVAEIRDRVRELGVACIFAEPQFEPRLVAVVAEGTNARTGVLDPLGAALEDGPDLYMELIRGLAASLTECLSQPG